MHLKFLILWVFVMTHTHDVINNGFKKDPQKSEKIWNSKLDDFFKFLTFVMSFNHKTLKLFNRIFVFPFSKSITKVLISFLFRVTWPGNRVRKNLPIDFEIRILNFERFYGLSYIKRKHVISRTQKQALKWNSRFVIKTTFIFRYEWWKWLFSTKII